MEKNDINTVVERLKTLRGELLPCIQSVQGMMNDPSRPHAEKELLDKIWESLLKIDTDACYMQYDLAESGKLTDPEREFGVNRNFHPKQKSAPAEFPYKPVSIELQGIDRQSEPEVSLAIQKQQMEAQRVAVTKTLFQIEQHIKLLKGTYHL